MIKIQKSKKHSVCNNCGKMRRDCMGLWEIKTTATGRNRTTMTLCESCMTSLYSEIKTAMANSGVY